MSGPLVTEKFVCWQGVDFTHRQAFFADGGVPDGDVQNLVPVDFTGAVARMNVRLSNDPSATSVLTLSGTAGGSSSGLTFVKDTFSPGPPTPSVYNGVEVSITRAQSLSMNGGVPFKGGYYDILVDKLDGTTELLICGEFELRSTVTR